LPSFYLLRSISSSIPNGRRSSIISAFSEPPSRLIGDGKKMASRQRKSEYAWPMDEGEEVEEEDGNDGEGSTANREGF
jgi:hypothetical protein